MEITDRARVLWSWLSDAIESKNDAEIVAHIALAFVEERKIAFRDHGEACANIAYDEYVGIQVVTMSDGLPDEWEGECCGVRCLIIRDKIRAFSTEASGFPIEGGE
jgi:hypothetical protein